MSDVLKTPEKREIRRALVNAASSALESQGWKVSRAPGQVKGRVRRITRNGQVQLAAIRTSQDHWIAFPRTKDNTKWATLSEVDIVVAAVVDDPTNPKFARVHMFDAKEVTRRFDRTLKARLEAGHRIQLGRGLWVPVYERTGENQVYFVGGGLGTDYPPIATLPLSESGVSKPSAAPANKPPATAALGVTTEDDDQPLTIAQAKARLARTLGVDPVSIKITVEA